MLMLLHCYPTPMLALIMIEPVFATVSDWDSCSPSDLCNYANGLDDLLQSACLPPLYCVHNCTVDSHQLQ